MAFHKVNSGFPPAYGVQFCDFSRLVNEREIAEPLTNTDYYSKVDQRSPICPDKSRLSHLRILGL
jgi:hypothetical protein